MQQIYKKRWISRFYQENGILIYADLNVSKKFYDFNQMGIPEGYNAFFTRGYSNMIEYFFMELDIARKVSGLKTPNFLVYGGGNTIRKLCIDNNLVFVEQFIENKKLSWQNQAVE